MSDAFVELDFTELDTFTANMLNLVRTDYPKEAKSFLRKVGSRMRSRLAKAYKQRKRVTRRTKREREAGAFLYKAVKRGTVYKYNGNEFQVRVFNTLGHAWLVEHGHKIHNTTKRTREFHVVGAEAKDFEKDFAKVADKFVDDLLKKGFA